jgi:hypothetical protein
VINTLTHGFARTISVTKNSTDLMWPPMVANTPDSCLLRRHFHAGTSFLHNPVTNSSWEIRGAETLSLPGYLLDVYNVREPFTVVPANTGTMATLAVTADPPSRYVMLPF